MDFHLEVLSNEFRKRVVNNRRYSMRAFAKSLDLHVSALSRILSGKQLLSVQASVGVAEKLGLCLDGTRQFLNSVIDAHRRQSQNRVGDSVHQPGLRQERVEAPVAARPHIEQVYCAALLELSMTKNFVWDADWISKRLRIPAEKTRQMMDVLLSSGMLVERDGKVTKAHRDTTSAGPLSEEHRRTNQAEILRLAEKSLMTLTKREHTQLTLVLAVNPAKIEDARKRFTVFLDEMGDFLQTGACDEVFALGLQFFPLTSPAP